MIEIEYGLGVYFRSMISIVLWSRAAERIWATGSLLTGIAIIDNSEFAQ